eukprot:Nitzschia sp. Nitz4//scaffold577_size2809//140//955//NITZ4_009285-RA/size2809-processed-gene-0.1-mRNA-1//-1//CDS//3329554798//920//frame0
MEVSQPGFIAQLKGKPTKQRYRCATVFVDHFSRLSFVHLQQSTSGIETLEAKKAFERFADSHGVSVKHYHADNGRFADTLFVRHTASLGQSISFCGVNAHHQNGIAEKRIRDLRESARTALLDALERWPKAIHHSLWPYAFRHANLVHANTPLSGSHGSNGLTPLELFSGSKVSPNIANFHPFGAPVYVLHDALAAGNSFNKWFPRARLAINLGPSPAPARSVCLALNPLTGMVSPQYHVKFDDLFETQHDAVNRGTNVSTWKRKGRFPDS